MYRDDDPSDLRGLKSILSHPIPSNQKFWFAVSGQIDSKAYSGGACSTVVLAHNYPTDPDLKCGSGSGACNSACNVS